jgi:hypothetical protein
MMGVETAVHVTAPCASTADLLWLAAPVLLLLSLVVTFEVAAALTISTLPRSRFQQQWTPHERRRVTRLFLSVFLFWPAMVVSLGAYLFLPLGGAIVVWALALGVLVVVVYHITHAVQHKRRVMLGHCTGCLYDLRGSLDRNHCPECGAALRHHPAIRRLRKASATSHLP